MKEIIQENTEEMTQTQKNIMDVVSNGLYQFRIPEPTFDPNEDYVNLLGHTKFKIPEPNFDPTNDHYLMGTDDWKREFNKVQNSHIDNKNYWKVDALMKQDMLAPGKQKSFNN